MDDHVWTWTCTVSFGQADMAVAGSYGNIYERERQGIEKGAHWEVGGMLGEDREASE